MPRYERVGWFLSCTPGLVAMSMPYNNSNYVSKFVRLGARVGFNDSLLGLASELTILIHVTLSLWLWSRRIEYPLAISPANSKTGLFE